MEMVEEIEYYGFSPLQYTGELYDALLNFLKTFSNRFKKNDRSAIFIFFEKNLSKTYEKFEIFAYNYIFKFPSSYSFERKQSDIVHERTVANEQSSVLEQVNIYEKKINYLTERKNYLLQLRQDNLRYANMLKHKSAINEIIENVKLIEEFCENDHILNLNLKNDENLKDLMKNKDLKNNIYKNEYSKLIKEKGTVEDIAEAIDKIKKF